MFRIGRQHLTIQAFRLEETTVSMMLKGKFDGVGERRVPRRCRGQGVNGFIEIVYVVFLLP
jgi:hypothetical protein